MDKDFVTKAHWARDENTVAYKVPIQKVDEQTRTVSGFATLNNVDRQGDVVRAEASMRAFERFRGNVREMHQPTAVGKVVSFGSQPYFDPSSEKMYDGVAVNVYISKGAEDTWQKVLDGTLSGFSIKGDVTDSETLYVDNLDGGQVVHFINDYELIELSIVDSPSNQLANVFSVQKSDTGEMTMTGMATEVEVKAVYWCNHDEIAKVSDQDSAECNFCDKDMEKIGWIELDSDNQGAVKEVVKKFLDSKNEEKDEGRIEKMSEENKPEEVKPVAEAGTKQEDGVTVEEKGPVEGQPGPITSDQQPNPGAEEVEKSTPQEVETPDFSKMLDEVRTSFSEGIEKSKAEAGEVIATLTAKVETVEKSFGEKVEALTETVKGLEAELKAAKEKSDSVEKSVDSLQGSSAIKKSSDVGSGDGALTREKNEFSWSGSFADANEL